MELAQYFALENPLILACIFRHLSLNFLCSCRAVNKLWNFVATSEIRKSLQSRLHFSAEADYIEELKRFTNVYQGQRTIPYRKAQLVVDHLPPIIKSELQEGEKELLLQLSELFSNHVRNKPEKSQPGDTLIKAWNDFSHFIDNLIVNLKLCHNTPENIEYWLKHLTFPNLTTLSFHITAASSDNISERSFKSSFESLPHLRSFGIKKQSTQGDNVLNNCLSALCKKSHVNRLKNLSLELYTDDKSHLKTLLQSQMDISRLSLIYLGGEVEFIEKLELIKQFLASLSHSLQYLHTHLPVFSTEAHQHTFPRLDNVTTLKIEKVYRKFAFLDYHLFRFDFKQLFPNIQSIVFQDYDIWKNLELKAILPEDVKPCADITCITLPDLYYDVNLLGTYFKRFPNLLKLSISLSCFAHSGSVCAFTLIYVYLTRLKDLWMTILETDIPSLDSVFCGIAEEQCRQLSATGNKLEKTGPSIASLQELETLKITSGSSSRILEITDLTVEYALLNLPHLRYLTLGFSKISEKGMTLLKEKMDVTVLSIDSGDRIIKSDLF